MKPTKDEPKSPPQTITGYAVLWHDINGLPWRREFPATPDGYIQALALELERNRISRATPLAEKAPSAAHMVPILG